MATEKQIEANGRNASLSTGPTSESGRARSRLNSTRHGLAGESAEVEAARSPEFEARRASWGEEYHPVGEAAGWAMDRAVAASFRIERCERDVDRWVDAAAERAKLAWGEDRAVEAAALASRLSKDPLLVSRKLRSSLAGADLLIGLWLRLVEAIEAKGEWSEAESSTALDLLGVPAGLRSGRTPIDPTDGSDPAAFRRALADEEIARLEDLIESSMLKLDEMERRHAIAGGSGLSGREAKLALRYEREAWGRYREAIRQVQGSAAPAPEVLQPPPAPAPTPAPRPAPRPIAPRPGPEDRDVSTEERDQIRAETAGMIRELGLEGLLAPGSVLARAMPPAAPR